KDANDGHQRAAGDIGKLRAGQRWRLAGAGEVGKQASITDVVQVVAGALAVGAVLAIAGDGADDEPRIALPQGLVRQAQPGQHSRPEALQQHVGPIHEAEQRVATSWVLEVDGDAALVAVDRQERLANSALERRHAAGVVAQAWLLNLDDVGAKIGKHLGGVAAGEQTSEVQYAQALEWQGMGVGHWRAPFVLRRLLSQLALSAVNSRNA